ncbi:RING-H2 finger protein ATL56-like [Impatiens glandulifera]|uniref:RING-H2 finger protein ATL56-like n=1 Tax=Impatiens glandulifera TaxID=253017 RepID=UPI001FB1204C|nr:RING-H2 finger protein ATL56-like [Impatiens glandulifera]
MQTDHNEIDLHECSGDELDSIPQEPSTSSLAAVAGQHMEPPPPSPKHVNPFWVILKGIVLAFIISLFFLILGIATAALFHFIAAGAPSHSRRPRRSSSSSSSSSSSFDSDYTAEELMRLLPCFEYSESDTTTTTKDCAICLDGFHSGERIRKLPNCNHTFHSNCVEKWLTRVSNCPICRLRLNLLTPDD